LHFDRDLLAAHGVVAGSRAGIVRSSGLRIKHQCGRTSKRANRDQLVHVAALHRMWNGMNVSGRRTFAARSEHASKM
jgi:hypothetical protein